MGRRVERRRGCGAGRQAEIYEAPGLVAELRRLRTKFTAGSASVGNPRVGGSHGDMAQALAMAVHEHRRLPGSPEGGAIFGRSSGLLSVLYSDTSTLIADGKATDVGYAFRC